MNIGRSLFTQVIEFLPLHEFRKCVQRYRGDYKVQSFSCLDQFLCMAFAQITYRESLRDIESCLRSMRTKLYHMGIRGHVSRNTLANANNHRDWKIYSDFAQILIQQARKLYLNEPFAVELDNAVYAFDATTIDLCLSLFPWAHFQQGKAAIQLHTLLDLRSNIPTFIEITDGNRHEVKLLDSLMPEPGAFYILDRGYLDFARLYVLHRASAFFIIRAKSPLRYRRLYSKPVNKDSGLICDQTIVLTRPQSAQRYPAFLRRVKFFDYQHNKRLTFLTNNFLVEPITVTQLYKSRWKIELFFKWIKQHLRIKAFFGTSANAVKTQIWIAISVYVLVAIIKKRLKIESSLYTILQILSVTVFEKVPLYQALTRTDSVNESIENDNQLYLFDL
jgi:hypothetical protein